jgi:hypothetical protein
LFESTSSGPLRSREVQTWTFFGISILLLKLLFFALDPAPKFYMGDSASYIWTALSDWIPEARSYFYGYVIRWSSVWTQSLTWLLVLQLLLSAITCILMALTCRFVFKLPARWSYSFGFVCALDPLQLLYERSVMTEAISLFLYALVLHRAFLYLRDRRWRDLALIQAVSVLLIGFRMSYLPLVQLDSVLLPLIAFSEDIWRFLWHRSGQSASRWPTLRSFGGHLLISVLLMLLLHTEYKQANGWISHRPPAYLHASGIHLLALLSPALEPQDSTDPGLADLIRHGDEFGLKDVDLRNSQRFSPGYLIDRFSKLHPERSGAERLARQTAMNALRRNPWAVARIAWHVYAGYWSAATMKQSAESDFSFANPPTDDLIALLASRFHLTVQKGDQTKSVLQWYYLEAWPYYFVLLVAPLLAGVVLCFRSTREYAVLLFIHICVMLTVLSTFGGQNVRFFQPISFATLLVIALLATAFVRANGREPS